MSSFPNVFDGSWEKPQEHGARKQKLKGVRWSSMVTCPRKAAYGARDFVKDEQEKWQTTLFGIRSMIGEAYQGLYVKHFGFKQEVAVKWPPGKSVGEGHIDLVSPEQDICELKTATGMEIQPGAVLQAGGYWWARRKNARKGLYIWLLNPSLGQEEKIECSPAEVEQDVKSLFEEGQQIAADTDYWPERAGVSPNDDTCTFCQYKSHCWAGYQFPDPDELILDRETVRKVLELTEYLKTHIDDDKKKERYKLLDEVGVEMDLDIWYEQHGVRIRKRKVTRAGGYDWRKAKAAAWKNPEQFEKEAKSYVVYDVKRAV